jgi:hypothetical protein
MAPSSAKTGEIVQHGQGLLPEQALSGGRKLHEIHEIIVDFGDVVDWMALASLRIL